MFLLRTSSAGVRFWIVALPFRRNVNLCKFEELWRIGVNCVDSPLPDAWGSFFAGNFVLLEMTLWCLLRKNVKWKFGINKIWWSVACATCNLPSAMKLRLPIMANASTSDYIFNMRKVVGYEIFVGILHAYNGIQARNRNEYDEMDTYIAVIYIPKSNIIFHVRHFP